MIKSGKVLILTSKRYLSSLAFKSLDSFSSRQSAVADETFSNVGERYKLILDVRSPGEYQIDHLPGAVNIPILDNEQRSEVGKIYNNENPVSARLLGASVIMKNMSCYIQPGGILFSCLHQRIRTDDDRIIVYCARGGQRSRSVAIILSEIGFTKQPVDILDGGYRSYRKQIIDDLRQLPNAISFVGICGLTGSAKTKILHCLRESGETVLDLEDLAKHKGSLFGSFQDDDNGREEMIMVQPPQKYFESKLRAELSKICNLSSVRRCRHNKPIVWLECESRNIGSIHLVESLWNQMQISKRVIIEASIEERVKHIIGDYNYMTSSKYLSATKSTIQWLSKTNPPTLIDQWISLADKGNFELLVESLLRHHYDPIYTRNREPFITCQDPDRVVKLSVESLDQSYIKREICSKLIYLSKSWLQ